MDAISSLITSKLNPSSSLKQRLCSAFTYIVISSAAIYLLFLLHSASPRSLWIAANAIIFFVYKLSSCPSNHSEIQLLPQPEKNTEYINTVHQDQEDDQSMDDAWKGIVNRRTSAADLKPSLKKSDTFSMPRLQREFKEGLKPELKKSATYTERSERQKDLGWRTRDVLVMGGQDELFRRVENFIKMQHDHLRLQRQESEHRRLLELFDK